MSYIEEVLAPVPSYVELLNLETKLEWQNKRIAELKELLKECKSRVLLCMEMTSVGYEEDEDLLIRINKTIGESEE